MKRLDFEVKGQGHEQIKCGPKGGGTRIHGCRRLVSSLMLTLPNLNGFKQFLYVLTNSKFYCRLQLFSCNLLCENDSLQYTEFLDCIQPVNDL